MEDYNDILPDLYSEHLPPDVLIGDHPADNQYMRGIEVLKAKILAQSRLMPSQHVLAIKLLHTGKKLSQVANEVGISANSVARIRGTPKGKKLLALLAYLNAVIDGPREDQRRHALWSIAQANHIKDPRVAIAAIAELNRMAKQDHIVATSVGGAQKLEIIINNNIPRGALDQ